MQETVNQETATEVKTFTQDELNAIVADRLDRERKKYEGFEDLKAKAEKFDEIEAANKTELQKATERAEKLEQELNGMKQAETLRGIRDKVAKETGVPAELLTGTTEEECTTQAKSIMEFAKPSTYPSLKDGGEVTKVGKPTTRQQFAEWANNAFN